jgi:hypothetical protein
LCLRSSSVIVSSKGKNTKKTKQNKTVQKKKNHNVPQVQMQYSFNIFSACRCGSVIVSSKVVRKKRVWRQFCEWLSEAVACLPAAVSLLLLEALFMQISGVSLTLIWPHRLCLLRVPLGSTATATSFPLSKHTGEVTLHQISQAQVFIYSSRGKWVFPPLLWSFPPTSTFTSFPAPGCWAFAAAPAFSSQLVYLQLT